MNEFKLGDAVRIKRQRGRPCKYIISSMYCGNENMQVEVTYFLNPVPEMTLIVDKEDIAFYKEYVKKEKIIDEQL